MCCATTAAEEERVPPGGRFEGPVVLWSTTSLTTLILPDALEALAIFERVGMRRPGGSPDRRRRPDGGEGSLDDMVDRASDALDENIFEPVFRSEHSSNAELLERIVAAEKGEVKILGKLKRIKVAAFAGFAVCGMYACMNLGMGRVLNSGVCCALAHDCFVVSYNAYHKKYFVAVANMVGGDLIAVGKTLLDMLAGRSPLKSMQEEVAVDFLTTNTIAKTLLHKFSKFLNK